MRLTQLRQAWSSESIEPCELSGSKLRPGTDLLLDYSSICTFAATPLNLKALTHLRSAAVLPTLMSEDVKLSLQCTPSTTTRSDALAIERSLPNLVAWPQLRKKDPSRCAEMFAICAGAEVRRAAAAYGVAYLT